MAVLADTARLLLAEHRRRPFGGALLELSRMLVYVSREDLEAMAAQHGVDLRASQGPALSHDPRLAREGCMGDRAFFSALGFDEVVVCDYSDYESPDVELDLNLPLPDELADRFDTVFEGGTLQHVFHVPNVLANIHRALRVGGRVVFGIVPAHNFVDHGFYTFSPTFFHDFYSANGYRIECARVCEFTHSWLGGHLYTSPWKIYEYTPGCLDHLSYGGFGREQLALFFVATKLDSSTGDVIPQQHYYLDLWSDPQSKLGWSAAEGTEAPAAPLSTRLVRRLARPSPRPSFAFRALLTAKRLVRRLRTLRRKMPPRVNLY